MKSVSIYCDWALHDEVGDTVPLTEQMTMEVLDVLERWNSEHDVSFDYYLVDAWWFEQPGDGKTFKRSTWPNGFSKAAERMRSLGMKPGLWVPASGVHLAGYEPWEGSLDVNGTKSHCFFDGPYAQGFRDALFHLAETYGVRMFKFDSAHFYAVTLRFRYLDAGEIYDRNVAALREIIQDLRAAYPDMVILAYNVFWYIDGFIESTTEPPVCGVDTSWLDYVDYLYSGDPRLADVSFSSLRRSTDVYQDHMVYKFYRSGIPLSRIDDHGCMVGRTNCNYYLGKTGWRRTWIQSLARGNHKAHFYGDVHALNENDVRFLKKSRNIFFDLMNAGAETRTVGGVPCRSRWHGFLTGNATDGLLILVNSGASSVNASLSIEALRGAHVLFHDGEIVPVCSTAGDTISVELGPEQMVLIGLGLRAKVTAELGRNLDEEPIASKSSRVDAEFSVTDGVSFCVLKGSQLAPWGRDYNCLRVSFELRHLNHARRDIVPMKQKISEVLRIDVQADGMSVSPFSVVPDIDVWTGCSWITGMYPTVDLRNAESVSIRFDCPDRSVDSIEGIWFESRKFGRS